MTLKIAAAGPTPSASENNAIAVTERFRRIDRSA
jgi:hypothetical protein